MISSVTALPSAGAPNSVFFWGVDKSPFMLMKKRENSPNLGKHCDKISQRIETANGRKPGIRSIVFPPSHNAAKIHFGSAAMSAGELRHRSDIG
jgi:hypothetical protein